MNAILRALFVLCVPAVSTTGCNTHYFSFGVYNNTASDFSDVKVVLGGNAGTWPIGNVVSGGLGCISMLPGSVPDSVDLAWTDPSGTVHSQHLQITPLPPPTATSYGGGGDREIYFEITADGKATVVYHDPHFKG